MRSILLFLALSCFATMVLGKTDQWSKKESKLLAIYDSSDSGTSMTLDKANKNEEAAKNKRNPYFPFYFSPLLIVIIAFAARRRRKRKEQENKK